MMCLVLLCSLSFTACSSDDNDNASAVVLNSFGPSPALRGGELRFIGLNLSKVESVVLQGTAEIKDIVKVDEREIKITIPQDAQPGLVTLKTSDGDIVTKTKLTFLEPISIASVTYANPLAPRYGDVITIKGDYLNLIKEVLFTGNDTVKQANFVAQSRQEIQVKVPRGAKTGKIAVSNGADIPALVYTNGPIPIQPPYINKPSANEGDGISPLVVKAGSEKVTIKGSNLDLVKAVVFGGTKLSPSFTVSDDHFTIVADVPDDAQDGKVILVAYAKDLIVMSEKELTMKMPVITAIAPNPVKNGETLTVTGTDLDLISAVTFTGDKAGTITSSSATKLEITVPMDAVTGKVTFTTKSTKSLITSADLNLVKPVISSFTPATIMAGNEITITGTNLDLVRKVLFSDNLSVNVTPSSSTSFVVKVPSTAVSGKIFLVAVNGDVVQSSDVLNVTAADVPVITSMNSSVKPGAKLTINGTKLNMVESVIFEDNVKATNYGSRTESLIEVYVPETAKKGSVRLKLLTYAGKEVVSDYFTVSGTDPVVDKSLIIYDFDGGNGGAVSGFTWDGIGSDGNPADAVSGNYYEIKNWDASKYWLFANNYISYQSVSKADYVLKLDVRLRNDVTGNAEVRVMLADKVVNILPYLKVGDVWTTGGDWKTITIPLTAFTDLADPTPVKGGNWGMAMWGGTANFNGLCIDNIRYEKK